MRVSITAGNVSYRRLVPLLASLARLVPDTENPPDKQIAATALIHDLTIATRNVSHYETTGVRLLNPFN
jgi:predicted nucleic acid-binding protein